MIRSLCRATVLFALSSSCAFAASAAPASPPTASSFTLNVSDSWTSTPFQIEAGKFYKITATGTWRGSLGQECGPNGSIPDTAFSVLGPQPGISAEQKREFFINHNPRDSLVARIGDSRWDFCVGTGVTFLAPHSGVLELRINDSDIASPKRSGSLQITFSELPLDQSHFVDSDGTLNIRARIDVSDFLHFTRDGISWEWGGRWGRPGQQEGYYPTILNGIYWWPNWKTKKRTAPLAGKEFWPDDPDKIKLIGFHSVRGTVSIENRSHDEFVLHFKKTEGTGAQEIAATINLLGKDVQPPPAAGTNGPIAEAPADPNAIERPEYRSRAKALVKDISTIHGMEIEQLPDGSEVGNANEIIAVVPGDSRNGGESKAVFVRDGEGDHMKTSFEEAIRAVKMRYPRWEPGRIEFSFGEKYFKRNGGSAGTAFSVLLLSILEGFNIDPKFAVTGDITVDWRVREIGGVPAKLTGATADKCLYAAIPDSNENDLDDMRLLYGDSSLWNIQVFSISTLQQAVALLRTDRDQKINDAMEAFSKAHDLYQQKGRYWTHNPDIHKALEQALTLAPNHLSAKHLLQVMDGKAPTRLSLNQTIEQYNSIHYTYDTFLEGKMKLNRLSLPANVTISTHRRLNKLQAIADRRMVPLIIQFGHFADMMDDLAAGRGTWTEVKSRFEAMASQEAALESQ